MTQRIMIIEDDVALAQLVGATLEREGFHVSCVHDGTGAADRICAEAPDLVILDIMLPGEDGFSILRALRPRSEALVLMLTARGDDFDQVTGLELGADDYMVKPVLPRLLVAKVRAMLRRAKRHASALVFGALVVHPSAREVEGRRGVIPLSAAEYDLLELLARNAGRVVEREELFRVLRGIEYDGLDRSMDLRVSKLRTKLRDHLDGSSPIRTVHGRGYMLAVR